MDQVKWTMHILLEEDGSTNMTNHNKQYIFAASIMDFEYIIVQEKIRQYLKPHEHFFLGRLSPVEFAKHFENTKQVHQKIYMSGIRNILYHWNSQRMQNLRTIDIKVQKSYIHATRHLMHIIRECCNPSNATFFPTHIATKSVCSLNCMHTSSYALWIYYFMHIICNISAEIMEARYCYSIISSSTTYLNFTKYGSWTQTNF